MGLFVVSTVGFITWGEEPQPSPEAARQKAGRLQAEYAKMFQAGRYEEASRIATQEVKLRGIAVGEDHPDYARSLNNLGVLLLWSGRNEEAIRVHTDALRIHRNNRGEGNREYAQTLIMLGQANANLGNLAAAETALENALRIHRDHLGTNHLGVAECLNELGLVYRAQGAFEKAEQAYLRSMQIWKKRKGGNSPEVASSLNNLAVLYHHMGLFEKVEALHRAAADIRKEAFGLEHPDYAQCLDNLGSFYHGVGKYTQAERNHRSALAIWEKTLGRRHPQFAQGLNNLAYLYVSMGALEQAEPMYREALDIWRGTRHPNYPHALSNLASLLYSAEASEEAERILQSALLYYRETVGKDHVDYALALHNIGVAHATTGQVETAAHMIRTAGIVLGKTLGGTHPTTAKNTLALASVFREYDPERAKRLYESGIGDLEIALGAGHPDVAEAQVGFGRLFVATDNDAAARALFHQALTNSLDNLEATGLFLGEYRQISQLLESRSMLDGPLTLATRETGEALRQTWHRVQRWKGGILGRHRTMNALQRRPDLEDEFNELRQLTRTFAQEALRFETPQVSPGKADRLATLQTKLEASRWNLARRCGDFRIARENPGPSQLRQRIPADAVLLDCYVYRHQLATGTAAARYQEEDRIGVFAVRRDGPLHFFSLPLQGLAEELQAWRGEDQFGYSGPGRTAGERIRSRIWAPLQTVVGKAPHVLVAPDGLLCQVPFCALPGPKPGTHLVETHAFSFLPAPRALAWLPKSESTNKSLFVVGGVDYDWQDHAGTPRPHSVFPARQAPQQPGIAWTDLPGTRSEVLELQRLHSNRFSAARNLLSETRASEIGIRETVSRHGFLHFATHGFFASDKFAPALRREAGLLRGLGEPSITDQQVANFHPGLLSGLVLAGANQASRDGDDGILTAEEVATLDLSQVSLAVLSACETGVGRTTHGEGLLGLQRSFHAAGAATVVASRWQVPDESTRRLMQRFYTNLWEHQMGRLESLREAQVWILRGGVEDTEGSLVDGDPVRGQRLTPARANRGRGARAWGAWTLSGDWR